MVAVRATQTVTVVAGVPPIVTMEPGLKLQGVRTPIRGAGFKRPDASERRPAFRLLGTHIGFMTIGSRRDVVFYGYKLYNSAKEVNVGSRLELIKRGCRRQLLTRKGFLPEP